MTDRFELLEELGAGGMGVVWKARDTATGELVALKVIHSHLAKEPDYIARFEREVEVARRVDSPHVVRVLGYGTRDGLPYMAMEYIEGDSLRERLRKGGPLAWSEAKPLARQVAAGLAAAHAAGIIHRDVKPSNILLSGGSAKLADFGIARALDMTRLTGSSTMLGTPHYLAPEAAATVQSDLYSLGCVIYEMLTGRPPFDGRSQQEVILSHIRDTMDLSPLPSDARPVVAWLTAKDPASRAKTAVEVVSVLEGSSHVPRVASAASTAAPRRRSSFVAVALGGFLGVTVMGGAVVAAVLATSGDDDPAVTPPAATATFRAVDPPQATRTPTRRPATLVPSAASTPTPDIAVGDTRRVANVGTCLNLRATPTTSVKQLTCLIEGTAVLITEGPVEAEGLRWWFVFVESYQNSSWTGWVAEADKDGTRWLVP